MTRTVTYHWHLRQLMAAKGMFATTELTPLLAERGIELSPAQVYRLVTQTPERLNLHVLVALCDILGCTPNDLIEPVAEPRASKRRRAASGDDFRGGGGAGETQAPGLPRPRRARILPDS